MTIVKFRDLPLTDLEAVRFVDFASTKPSKQNPDPDFTAGCLIAVTTGRTQQVARGEFYVIEARWIRDTPARVEDWLWDTHVHDDELLQRAVPMRVEQEGGSAGTHAVDQMARGRFVGVDFRGVRPRGSKIERAKPAAIAAERGSVHLVEGAWNESWLSNMELFPDGAHDDDTDAFSGGFNELAKLIRVSQGTIVRPMLKRDPDQEDDDPPAAGGWNVSL